MRSRPSDDRRRLRIAFVSFEFGEFCVPLVNALAQRADVSLLMPADELEPHRDRIDPLVAVYPFTKPRLRQPLRQAGMCRGLARTIRGVDPHVLHVQQGHLWFNLLLPWLRRRYPTIVTIHDLRPHLGDELSKKTPQRVMNIAFRSADRLIVHADVVKQAVVAELGLASSDVDVIPLTVPELIPIATERSPESTPEPRVLFFGRIWPYKGLEYLIRAEPRITEVVPDTRIVIAGTGEDIGRYTAEMTHPDRFDLHNDFVTNDELAGLLDDAAVVVAPYVDATQSGVIPLAYAAARPVVATDVGGLPEMVEHGVTGFVIPPRDAAALADAVLRILKDPQLWHAMSAAAHSRAVVDWSPARLAAQTIDSYERLQARRGVQP
jgi:glycosyltransferase involved in cell wall biosynthesis